MDPILKLYSYINIEDSRNTYYKLSLFVIKNIKRLPELSISQFAEESFVSKATITRFIQFLEFESYAEFKSYFDYLNNSSKLSFLKLTESDVSNIQDAPLEFLHNYTQKITESIQDTVASMDVRAIDSLIHSVKSAKKVAFLGFSDSNTIAKDIQLGCLSIGKFIEIAESSQKFYDILERFDSNDLIVILSNYGNFFSVYHQLYNGLLSKKIPLILVTQNYSTMDSFRFKQTIYLTSKRQLNIGNYPMRIFSEYFVRRITFI
ncbi:TPA: MurR/RpiR family transcriptional regulator [Enterococcus faecium]